MDNKWRQELGEAGKPSNTGARVSRQWETRGDKTSGRRTHHPTKGNKKGDGRQGETRPPEGGHTIQHRQTRGDKTAGRRTNHPRRRHHPTQTHMWGDKGRQDLGKADPPSNTGTHVGTMEDNSETRCPQGGHNMWGENGR